MTTLRNISGCAVLILLIAGPPLLTEATQNILGKMLIAGIFATGFSLLAGRTGLLSFGHAAFYGLGAIVTLQLMGRVEHSGLSFPTPFVPVAGAIAGGLLAAPIGYIATRRSGSYFTLTTLAFAELMHALSTQWHSLFGGESGLTSMRMPWAGLSFGSELEVYYCVLAWFAAVLLLCWLLTRTAFDQILVAIRENEERTRFVGYGVQRFKVIAFALSGAISGLAGGLLAFANESATYTLFEPYVSLQVLLQSYIGGISLFGAPAASAALLTYLPYGLSDWTRMWPLYQGLIFMVIVIVAPVGLGSLLLALRSASQHRQLLSLSRVSHVVLCMLVAISGISLVEFTHFILDSGRAAVAKASVAAMQRSLGDLPVSIWGGALLAILAASFLFLRSAGPMRFNGDTEQ